MPLCPLKSCAAFQQWLTWSSASWPFLLDWLDLTTALFWCSTSMTSTLTWNHKACCQRSSRKLSPPMTWWVVVGKSSSLYLQAKVKQRGRDTNYWSVRVKYKRELSYSVIQTSKNTKDIEKQIGRHDLICWCFEVNILLLSGPSSWFLCGQWCTEKYFISQHMNCSLRGIWQWRCLSINLCMFLSMHPSIKEKTT